MSRVRQSLLHGGYRSHSRRLRRPLLPLKRRHGSAEALAVRKHGEKRGTDLREALDHVSFPRYVHPLGCPRPRPPTITRCFDPAVGINIISWTEDYVVGIVWVDPNSSGVAIVQRRPGGASVC